MAAEIITPKSHAEIIAECYHSTAATQYVRKLLDSLDAAHKRERGDCAKLREAIENSNGLLEKLAAIGEWGESAREQIAENNAALAEPVKNCDVGTAEVQLKRKRAYCKAQGCRTCPFYGNDSLLCAFRWAQGPYSGNDKAHAAASIMGRESINKQCHECANCNEPTAGWDRSKFRCAFLGKDFDTWHYDVPNECPCKGKGWIPKKKEGGNDGK